MRYWITTDTHFGHSMLRKEQLRPEEFEDKILKSIYKNVRSNDILIHLGDFAFNDEFEWSMKFFSFPCKKWLLKGNHDKQTTTWYIDHGWDFVADTISFRYFGLNILFSHIPQKLRLGDGIDLNIHGHFHNTDHRKHEPHIAEILTNKHYLLAPEYNNYQVWNLENIIKKFRRERLNRMVENDSE